VTNTFTIESTTELIDALKKEMLKLMRLGHLLFYSMCFVRMGILWERIRHSNIVVAITSAGIIFAIVITSAGFFRRRYHWWFRKTHAVGSLLILPLLFFHISHVRIYIYESAIILLMNTIVRMVSSRKL